MADNCPNCGTAAQKEQKFCPACGEPLTTEETASDPPAADPLPEAQEESILADPEPPVSPGGERVFVLRKKNYGDTSEFEDPAQPEKNEKERHPAAKSNLSLYISIFAAVLSITAIVLVIIFAVIPADRQAAKADNAPTETAATAAPTQPPTESPIAGTYELSMIDNEKFGLATMMLRGSTLEMNADYTGALMFSGKKVSDVSFNKEDHTAVFMKKDCAYSFDGNTLTIDYQDMTLVYKKK